MVDGVLTVCPRETRGANAGVGRGAAGAGAAVEAWGRDTEVGGDAAPSAVVVGSRGADTGESSALVAAVSAGAVPVDQTGVSQLARATEPTAVDVDLIAVLKLVVAGAGRAEEVCANPADAIAGDGAGGALDARSTGSCAVDVALAAVLHAVVARRGEAAAGGRVADAGGAVRPGLARNRNLAQIGGVLFMDTR